MQRRKKNELQDAEQKSNSVERRVETNGSFLEVPATFDDMVRQAARVVERAFKDGKTRQTVRFNLVTEEQSAVDKNEFPGGSRQIYRESGNPLTTALLREIRAPTKDLDSVNEQRRLPPTIKAQDLWDFDGSALHTAEAAEGASADVQALVFPNTDVKYIDDIEKISEAMGPRLFLLVNPSWRDIESWSFNMTLQAMLSSPSGRLEMKRRWPLRATMFVTFRWRSVSTTKRRAVVLEWTVLVLLRQ
jgi:hypothetical protein